MLKIIKQLKRKYKKYKNGKELSKSGLTPEIFVNKYLISEISNQVLPKYMKNKDVYRRQDSKNAIKDLHQEIINKYFAKQSGFLPYDQETPYNKMRLWGVMFAVLYGIFIKQVLQNEKQTKTITINSKQYNKLPMRYRGLFLKISDNLYTYNHDKSNAKFHILHTCDSKETLYARQKQIQTALPVIYKKQIINMSPKITKEHFDFDDQGNGYNWHEIASIKTHGQIANKNSAKSNFVSDKQMESIEQLKIIFKHIAKECIVLKPKHGAREIYSEYIDEKNRKQIVTKAQKLTRTANQMVASARKTDNFCDDTQIQLAEAYYKKVKLYTLHQLQEKISTKIN